MQRQMRARAKSVPRPPIPPVSPHQLQVPTESGDRSGSGSGSGSGSVPADELTKMLLKFKSSSPSPLPLPSLSQEPTALIASPLPNEQHTSTATSAHTKYAFPATPPRPHWPDAYNRRESRSSDRHHPHTRPVARSNTTHRNTPTQGNMTAFPQFPHPHQQQQTPHNLQRAKTSATSQSRPRSNRPSHEMPEQRQRTETLVAVPVRQRANTLSSRPSTATSAITSLAPPLPAAAAPLSVPTLPGRGFAHPSEGGPTLQQRVFIGDMQRFSTVEIGPGTKARDVIAMVDEKGELPHEGKAGGWMLFELSNDFGMGE